MREIERCPHSPSDRLVVVQLAALGGTTGLRARRLVRRLIVGVDARKGGGNGLAESERDLAADLQ